MSREGIDRVHNERMDALNKAYKYTELANNMLFMSEARHALENLRIAILQENVDYQKHMKVLAEEEMMMLQRNGMSDITCGPDTGG